MRALSEATGYPVPEETAVIRESYLQAAEFVGRETELSELIGALQGLVYGSAARMDRLWLVGGESGVGKSRLVDELRTRALVEGALVLQGQAVADGGLSYQLLRDVVRRLVLLVEPEPEELPALRLVVPDIDRLLDRPANGNGSVDMAAQRERLPLVIERMLTAVAAERPVLFIGEDLQWAAESLPVLNHLSKFAANGRLMILGTYRDDERPNLPSELPGMRVMRLTRLAAEEIAKLSAAMLGEAGQRDQVVSLLERETEGNVFFVVEVVRALAEEAGGLGFVGQATLPQQVFAGGIQRIVARRLDAVPDWARSALHLAAVIGRQVDPALMRDAMPKLEIDVWLRLCVDVAVFEAQEDRYRFAHDRLRESVLNRLSEAEQVSLHQQAAESIETIYAESLDEYAVVLARHWAAARDTEREGRYAALAARKAWHLNEYRDSRAFYQRALELKTYDRENDPAKALADLTYGLGRACYGLSDYRESRTHQDAALVMYREQGDEAGIGLALAALGELDMRQGKNRDAQPQVEESLAIHRKLGDRRQEAYNLMNLGVLSAQLSEFARARDYFEQCHAVMQELDEPIGLARALNNLGVINDMQGDIDAATTYYERSLEIRRQINDRQGIAYSLTNLSALAMDRDDFELARNYQAESLSLLRQVGEKLAVANAAGNLSNSLRELGELDEAERLQHESLSLRRDIGDPGSISISLVSMGQIRQKRGDIEAAKRYFHEALATVRQSEEHARLVGTIHTIARFIQNQGDKRRGVELLAFVRKQNQEMGIAGRDTEAHLAELAGQLVSHVYEDAVARGEAQEMDTVVEALLATLANGQGS
jgi:predicted ATPase